MNWSVTLIYLKKLTNLNVRKNQYNLIYTIDFYNFIIHSYKLWFYFSDTAAVYNNEEYIRDALKVLLPKYNLKREDLFITSKLGIYSIIFPVKIKLDVEWMCK